MAEKDNDIIAQLSQLRNEYKIHLQTELAELAGLTAKLNGSVSENAVLDDLYHRLHKLAGSGGSFGFNALSEEARHLELMLKACLSETGNDDEVARKRIIEGVAALATTPDAQDAQVIAKLSSPGTAAANKCIPIWLVEDDDALGQELARVLRQFGFDVRLFTRFDDAEAAACREQPGVLIMDVLFREEGLNSTEALSNSPALQALHCPKLFISEEDDFQSRVRAARLGADGFMLKPLNIPRLIDRLEYILAQQQAEPYRVLIVDDDATLSEHFRLVLNMAGIDVSVLNTTQNIIGAMVQFRPELILLDLLMPGFSGSELAAIIRQYDEWLSLPIVFLSAETDLDTQISAMGRGADDFIIKPISDAQLTAAVRVRAARSRQIAELMSKDSLTGLLKHARIKEEAQLELARSQRTAKPMSLAMLDIDHFKKVNDTYGHAVGDQVIRSIAHLLRQHRRKSDSVGRYGGEEFVILLPECGREAACELLEDIRQRFTALSFRHEEQEFSCTLSAGIATSPEHFTGSSVDLFIAADVALYIAKRGGRNQVRYSVL